MVDTVGYCGGANELDGFLDTLRWNFNCDGHLFPHGGLDHIKYAISLLDTGSNRQIPAQRLAEKTEPSEWAGDLPAESDPCLQDLKLFWQETAKVYVDKDRRCVAVISLMQC